MCSIPLELQEHALDCLRGDRRTLVCCALVCKAWIQRARHNLLHTIHIDWEDRARTRRLFNALQGAHAHVHNLTLSSKAGLQPEEFVALFEALENLEILSIHVLSTTPGILSFISSLTGDATTGERLLSAITNKAQLRALEFTMPSRALYAWTPNTGPQPSSTVLGHSLRRLHSFHGHMFPVERMYRLWAAITAAKAQEGAVPLTHLGTSMARSGFQPFARFLEASGTHLQSLHLDMRVVAFWREDNAVDAFHSSGLSLSGCRQLRKLTVGLHAPSRRWSCSHVSVFAALLCTTARCAPLAHITVIFDILTTEAFEIPGFPEGLAALDGRMAEMPQLRRVDWLLAQSGGGRQQSPDDVNSVEYRSGMLKTYFCAVARREEVEVSWRALRRD